VSDASETVSHLTLEVTQLRQNVPQKIRQYIQEESDAFLKSLSEPMAEEEDVTETCIGNDLDWNDLEDCVKESAQILENRSQVYYYD
jgi:hypothetical protein